MEWSATQISPVVVYENPNTPERNGYTLKKGYDWLIPRMERIFRLGVDGPTGWWWCEEFWEWDDEYCRLKGWKG